MNRDPYLPLTETTYYTLVALLEPCHGYKILSEVKKLSNGQVHLAPGTLYGALENLEKQGLITLVEEEGPRKKIFQIAKSGLEVLKKDQQRLLHMANLLGKDLQGDFSKDKDTTRDNADSHESPPAAEKRNNPGFIVIKDQDEKEQKQYINSSNTGKKINRPKPERKKREEDLFY